MIEVVILWETIEEIGTVLREVFGEYERLQRV
jgi:hypothetical protein